MNKLEGTVFSLATGLLLCGAWHFFHRAGYEEGYDKSRADTREEIIEELMLSEYDRFDYPITNDRYAAFSYGSDNLSLIRGPGYVSSENPRTLRTLAEEGKRARKRLEKEIPRLGSVYGN